MDASNTERHVTPRARQSRFDCVGLEPDKGELIDLRNPRFLSVHHTARGMFGTTG